MTLQDWIARQRAHAAAMMCQSISPTRIVKTRPGFGQTIRPVKGAVVASPVLGAYDPEPDYFFHWYRDSALVMDALFAARDLVPEAPRHFADFVRFSRGLAALDGRAVPRPRAQAAFERYLRVDLARVWGARVAADSRVNPDGTLDISDWPRPQHDGPALRALALLRWGAGDAASADLLTGDLHFLLAHARAPAFDIWEEEMGVHYYTLRVAAAALTEGAAWADGRGDGDLARACRAEAAAIGPLLEAYWRGDGLVSRLTPSPKQLDVSVILAIIHARAPIDARAMATLAKLEAWAARAYPINADRPQAPALGRYPGDIYYGGGPWYLATLAAAEFCYRAGALARGDGYLQTVRAFTPASGDLSEQFDGASGAQVSARHLAWSYAAFLTAAAARAALVRRSARPAFPAAS